MHRLKPHLIFTMEKEKKYINIFLPGAFFNVGSKGQIFAKNQYILAFFANSPEGRNIYR